MTSRGRGVVRQWTKTCSDYDEQGNATEVLYQTVFEGRVFEIRATPDEVVFFQSPRRQVRAPSVAVLETVLGHIGQVNPAPGGNAHQTLEDALDDFILSVDKPESVSRFNSLSTKFEQRPQRAVRSEFIGTEGE